MVVNTKLEISRDVDRSHETGIGNMKTVTGSNVHPCEMFAIRRCCCERKYPPIRKETNGLPPSADLSLENNVFIVMMREIQFDLINILPHGSPKRNFTRYLASFVQVLSRHNMSTNSQSQNESKPV